jgi:hypothetical protein
MQALSQLSYGPEVKQYYHRNPALANKFSIPLSFPASGCTAADCIFQADKV